MSSYKNIIPFAKRYKKYAFLNIFFNILYALFSTLSFVSLIPMLDVLFGQAPRVTVKPAFAGITSAKEYLFSLLNYYLTQLNDAHGVSIMLAVLVSGIIAIFLLKNFADYMAMYFITFLRNGVLRDIRNAMYDKVVHLPISFFSEKRRGDVIARISNDVNEVQTSMVAFLEMIVKEPLTIVFTLVMMFMLSVKLTVFVFVFIPISGYIISLIGKKLKRQSAQAQAEQGQFLSTIEETLGGLKVVKSYNAERHFANKFEDSTKRYFKLSNAIGNRQNLASPMSEFMGIAVIATLLWFGGNMVLVEGTLAGSSFIAYMGLAYNILTPAKAISKASYAVKRGEAAAERILEIIDEPNPIADTAGATILPELRHAIALNQVTFAYEQSPVLKNFSLEIPKGKMVALVGQSGSGKSTIANLLTRFYDVEQGTITIDGTNIKSVTLASLRGQIGLVTQDSILFNDTIRANVALGKADATDEEIWAALKIANAYEFVAALPNGIHTNVGDAGGKLSGGQKQRLSIARAVLKNPPIMILDEATSALDTESERLVQDALENLMRNRTSIVIAHRLSTIQKADWIVVMQKGEIVEQGTHDLLLEKGGMYRKLVQLQSFE